MSIQFPEFVGRDTELKKIAEQIARQGQTVVVNIAGAGGVGKTAILRKIKSKYSSPDTLVTDLIDFSQTVHRVEPWVLAQIAQISPSGFSTYRNEVQSFDAKGSDPLARLYHEREARDAFVKDYNVIAENRRLILLFDTLELVQESLLDSILELAKKLNNTVIVLAGRRNADDSFIERLDKLFKPEQMLNLDLTGFSLKEAKLYFSEAVAPRLKKVHDDLQRNIYLLSDGNPIKIALSLHWLDRGIPLIPEITQKQPAELENLTSEGLAEWQTKFEYALLDGVRQLESPADEIVLYMAHLNKRFNRDMLEFFFPDFKQSSAELIAQLRDLPFVKYVSDDYFVLHDEMTRLVQQHVWDSVEDPDKTLRRELSGEVCGYYLRELEGFPEWGECTEQQRVMTLSYRVECMYYNLYESFQTGYYEFERLFEELVNRYHRPGLAALAVDFIREFENEAEYSELLACFVDGYYQGGVLLSQQRFKEAEKRLSEGEQRLGETISKLDFSTASSLDRHLGGRMYEVYNQLGYCYRQLGEWDRAIQNYEKSLERALESVEGLDERLASPDDQKGLLLRQIAETLNNLANVHRMRGDLHRARLLCQTGTLLRQTWDRNKVVMSQYVMGMVLWEIGHTAEAVAYLRRAESSCRPEDEVTKALIKMYQAYILFRTGLPHLSIPLLGEVESVFRQRGRSNYLADVLNIRSRIFRDYPEVARDYSADRNHMELSEQYAIEAQKISEQIGDSYRLAEAHLTRAIHYHHQSQVDLDRSQIHREAALKHWEHGVALAKDRYYQLWSLYSQVRGDIAFYAPKPDYGLAFSQYVQQCRLATRFKRAVYERSIDHLGERLRALGNENPELAKEFIEHIIDEWSRDFQSERQYSDLIQDLQEIKRAINEIEALRKLRTRREQAMLAGDWSKVIELDDKILEIPSLYDDVNRADVILSKSRAAHRLGNLSEARRLAKVALQIGYDLQATHLIGNAHLSLASILWDTTSTAEAAAHLDKAEAAFRLLNDEIGLARVARLRAHILYRTGSFEDSFSRLQKVTKVFEKNGMNSELADVWNLMSRIARTDPDNPDFDKALEYAQRALERAETSGDSYRIAECYLSLAILAYRQRDYKKVLNLYDTGMACLPSKAHSVRSVYDGIRGAALYELGKTAAPQDRTRHWDEAFDFFTRELIEATQSKPASIVRALGLVYESLMELSSEKDVKRYAQQIEDTWKEHQPDQDYEIVIRMCEHAVRYHPYIQINANRKDK